MGTSFIPMAHRIVTISNPAFLRMDLGRLQIEQGGQVQASIPIEDMAILLVESGEVVLSHQLLARLAEANVGVILCDSRHLPNALVLPLSGHSTHAKTIRGQVECSEPKRKQLWKQIVVAKLESQARILGECSKSSREAKSLRAMAANVKSGDPDNYEAQGAAIYFEALFGKGFVREREEPGINAMLNYGYVVLRAMVARAIVGAGLHPALGIHHKGPYNPFNLADDAIEPLRPVVDRIVFSLAGRSGEWSVLTTETKRSLLEVTVCPVKIAGATLPMMPALERYASNIREAICGSARKLQAPGP